MNFINGFTDYKITVDGKIYSTKRTKVPKLLKTPRDRYGYFKITLLQNGIRYYKTVHRLVAETYLENPNNLPQVNHIDGNKLNNNVDNLEWCTNLYNMRHAHSNGLIDYNKISGINCYISNLTQENVIQIRVMVKQEIPYKIIAKKFNISKSTISRIKLKQAYKNI